MEKGRQAAPLFLTDATPIRRFASDPQMRLEFYRRTIMASATQHPDHQLISSEDVEGTNVYGAGDAKVGEIDHLMIDKFSGKVTYAVMSFGGFLGLGHSHYPVPWAALKYDPSIGGYRTGITEQQ